MAFVFQHMNTALYRHPICIEALLSSLALARQPDAVKKYQSATSSKRQSEKIEELIIDGRGGVLFVQNENSGRRILEALIWDPVPTGQSENSVPVTVQGSFVSPGSAREISLQLPGTATANDRILYEKLYREILNSIKFIKR